MIKLKKFLLKLKNLSDLLEKKMKNCTKFKEMQHLKFFQLKYTIARKLAKILESFSVRKNC